MVTIPLVVLLGFLAFAVVKWGGQKAFGVIVGTLFGLALASTVVGPPILRGMTTFSEYVIEATSRAVER